MTKGKEPCPECGIGLSPLYLPNHRRSQHGVYGGRTGRVRGDAHKKNGKLPVKAPVKAVKRTPRVAQPVAGTFTELPYKVIVDTDGRLWIAEPLGRNV